jgi:hypothetical protein
MEVNARFERAKEESAAMNTNTKSSECRNEAVFDSTLERVAGLNWAQLEADLNSDGFATTPILLEGSECRETVALYADEDRFRSRIVMERYSFGRGEYKYFRYPLPCPVQMLRESFYAGLAPIANRWHQAMRMKERFPPEHNAFIEICRAAGQTRPTPLMLKYGVEDYCCLHQDLYGGELLLTESDPKRAGRVEVVPLVQGQAVVFAVNSRPVRSARGFYRVDLRHGVSRLIAGHRHTLGIIFHDAK